MPSERDSLGIVDATAQGTTGSPVARTFRHVRMVTGFLALEAICLFARESERMIVGCQGAGVTVSENSAEVVSAVRNLCELVTLVSPERSVARTSEERTDAQRGDAREDRNVNAALDAVSELVAAQPYAPASAKAEADRAVLGRQLERLGAITSELQRMAAWVRLVPMRATFDRAEHYVRDLATRLGKDVDLFAVGGEVELDEASLALVSDGLFAALRRSVTDSIEKPLERRAAGKPPRGRIELRARNTGSVVHLELHDDGRGAEWSAHVPLALAIIEGLILRVGDDRYVVPLASIDRALQPSAEQIVTADEHVESLALEDGLVPILRLHELHVSSTAETDLTRGTVLVVEHEGERGAVFGCELLGGVHTVVQPIRLDTAAQGSEAYSAMLPDGHLAMVLDPAELVSASRAMGLTRA